MLDLEKRLKAAGYIFNISGVDKSHIPLVMNSILQRNSWLEIPEKNIGEYRAFKHTDHSLHNTSLLDSIPNYIFIKFDNIDDNIIRISLLFDCFFITYFSYFIFFLLIFVFMIFVHSFFASPIAFIFLNCSFLILLLFWQALLNAFHYNNIMISITKPFYEITHRKIEIIREPIITPHTLIFIVSLIMFLPVTYYLSIETATTGFDIPVPKISILFIILPLITCSFVVFLYMKNLHTEIRKRWILTLPNNNIGMLLAAYFFAPTILYFLEFPESYEPVVAPIGLLIMLSLPFVMLTVVAGTRNLVLQNLLELSYTQYESSERGSYIKHFDISIYVHWFLFALINIFGLLNSFGFIIFLIFDYEIFLLGKIASNFYFYYGNNGLFVFSLPVIVTFFYALFREFSYGVTSATYPASRRAFEKMREVSDFANIGPVDLMIQESGPAMCFVRHHPFSYPIIVMTKRAIDTLTAQELSAVLAHEIWHVKKHSMRYAILNWFSKTSLFGNGFHTLAISTMEYEFEADAFAVQYLRSAGISHEALVAALVKFSTDRQQSRALAFSNSALYLTSTELENEKERVGFLGNLRWLFEIYFGDLIISYIHPTLDERINRIMQNG